MNIGKLLFLLWVLCLASFDSSAASVSCTQVFSNRITPHDDFRSYAVGRSSESGVTRIHVVDFYEPTLSIRISPDRLVDIVTRREQFNKPKVTADEIASSFNLHIPKAPLQTKLEFEGTRGRRNRSFIDRRVQRLGNVETYSSRQSRALQRFEFEADGGSQLLFLVEFKTRPGALELIFQKTVNVATMDVEVLAYAVHLASRLGVEVLSVSSVMHYGGSPDI